MSENKIMRSNYCNQVGKKVIGDKVTVAGWVHRRRDHGGVIFVDLRDTSGLLQLVFNPENIELFQQAEKIRSEFVISVNGVVRDRPEGTINDDMPTGAIEILVSDMSVLNTSLTPPFHHDENTNEDTRLKYRYLDLRRSEMADKLKIRHNIIRSLRNFLDQKEFIWQNKFFYDYVADSEQFQIFAEVNTLYSFGKKSASYANDSLGVAPGVFVSYFPNQNFTILGLVQHYNLIAINNGFAQNYTAVGAGAKYQLTRTVNFELIYTNFVRRNDTGLGQTFNFGLRALLD